MDLRIANIAAAALQAGDFGAVRIVRLPPLAQGNGAFGHFVLQVGIAAGGFFAPELVLAALGDKAGRIGGGRLIQRGRQLGIAARFGQAGIAQAFFLADGQGQAL